MSCCVTLDGPLTALGLTPPALNRDNAYLAGTLWGLNEIIKCFANKESQNRLYKSK